MRIRCGEVYGKEVGALVTRKRVAEIAKVSEATVSNVINGKIKVADGKRERVLSAIKELNYIPDQTARNLAMGCSRHIGIAIYETTNPYHMELARAIEDYASKKGYVVSLFMLDNNIEHKLEVISQRKLDCLINFMTNRYPDGFIETLKRTRTMLINFDEASGSVFCNDYADAMRQILIRVKELGHTKIAYLCSQDELGFAADSRGKQWFKSVAELGFEEARVLYNQNFDNTSDKIGYALAHSLIEEFSGSTVVFTTNDLSAIGCIRALAEKKIRVPQDISVIGCDDISIAEIMVPSLTSIALDKVVVGADMARQAIKQITTGTFGKITYEATPVYRESLAVAKK